MGLHGSYQTSRHVKWTSVTGAVSLFLTRICFKYFNFYVNKVEKVKSALIVSLLPLAACSLWKIEII